MDGTDTIFALSSGQPPAAIAVIRVSGLKALETLDKLARVCPPPRQLMRVELCAGDDVLDRALVARFDAPNTATGEDLAEFHLHGGRAVVEAVSRALAAIDGVRPAEPGEFTRRAFANGRIDLAEAEGLADLLAAETDGQRRAALLLAGGALSRRVEDWTQRLLALAASIEARLDFSDEGDVEDALPSDWETQCAALAAEIATLLALPPAERLRDGVRIVIAGPPNSGKSTLLNALAGRDAAITSAIAGTTRDLIEAPVVIEGVPLLLTDTAGLRDSGDLIEGIGVDRAQAAITAADLVLWLGPPDALPDHRSLLTLHSKVDLGAAPRPVDLSVSPVTGSGMAELAKRLVAQATALLPRDTELSVNRRQRSALEIAVRHLDAAGQHDDLLVAAEELRLARSSLDAVTGRAGVEDMLDGLFGRFCIGK